METFTTIQGEGFHSGRSAHFLRIGGCDIGCHWCDIKESWNSNLYPLVKIENIIETINSSTDLVVISGGEPLIWNMSPLTNAIKKLNIEVADLDKSRIKQLLLLKEEAERKGDADKIKEIDSELFQMRS